MTVSKSPKGGPRKSADRASDSARRPGKRPAARPGVKPAAAAAPPTRVARLLPSWVGRHPLGARRFAVLTVVAGLLVLLLAPTVRAWVNQRNQISDLRAGIDTKRATVDQLEREQLRWQDPDYVAQQARERLKFVMVGETSYTVLDASPTATVDKNLLPAPGSVQHPWYGKIWASIEAADAPASTR